MHRTVGRAAARGARSSKRLSTHFFKATLVTPSLLPRLAALAGLSMTLLLAAPSPSNATLATGGSFHGADHEPAIERPPTGIAHWYDRFHDDTLSALVRSAAARALAGEPATTGSVVWADRPAEAAEAAAASAYVVARATAVRRLLLADAQVTLLRERQFVSASAPVQASAAALARVDAALATSREQAASLGSMFRESTSRLAALCGSTPEAMEALLLHSSPAMPRLPVFDTTAISTLPLDRLTAGADRAEALAKAREDEFRATELRNRLGGASEMDVIAAYRRLLIVNDALAVAAAELALGWIGLGRQVGSTSPGIAPHNLPLSSQRR